MLERDRPLILQIGDLTRDYVDGEFGLDEFCQRFDRAIAGIRAQVVRKAFGPALMVMEEVRDATAENRGYYHVFDVTLETWAVSQIEALVEYFGAMCVSDAASTQAK